MSGALKALQHPGGSMPKPPTRARELRGGKLSTRVVSKTEEPPMLLPIRHEYLPVCITCHKLVSDGRRHLLFNEGEPAEKSEDI
jgi:hypothetical protein